tara:strand:+ start:1196 stop:2212 length:1017 start_codon:yes stop_codon:yes gene_type:complete
MCLGLLLNLFEEIEFFKDLNESMLLPFLLTLSFIPSLIIDLLPFVVFLASMFFFKNIRSNTDLISIKILGYSNLKIVFILSITAFIFGNFILVTINPITSTLTKYYEQTKAKYSKDTDHLVAINKNGLWIKENYKNGSKIITAKKLEDFFLKEVTIYEIDNDYKLLKRLESKKADISSTPWVLNKAVIYDFRLDETLKKEQDEYRFITTNTLEKINSLYRNLNTISFLSLVTDYSSLTKKGYKDELLKERLHRFISLPVFLFLMVVLAAVFSLGSVKKSQNLYYVAISILACVFIYYFKDLSIALGQTERISLTLSVWMPIIAVALFCSIGIIQINEK